MSRGPRQAPGGFVYHVLNRAVARLPLFEKPADYAAFLRVLAEALEECPIRILAFVLMPNHWHFVLWPEADGQLTDFCRWLAHTHSMRWHAHYHKEADGSWPCIAVRDAIEEVEGDALTPGFEIGIYNKRGSYMKSPTEGGAQEWDLAKSYQAWADTCVIDWPKTARSLRSVASKYEHEARREDATAQLDV